MYSAHRETEFSTTAVIAPPRRPQFLDNATDLSIPPRCGSASWCDLWPKGAPLTHVVMALEANLGNGSAGSDASLYVDGSLKAHFSSISPTAFIPRHTWNYTSHVFRLGENVANSVYYGFGLYNRALSSSEVEVTAPTP